MKTELEKCLAGEPFNGGDKVLADMTLNAKRLLKQLNETDYADTEQRKRIFMICSANGRICSHRY